MNREVANFDVIGLCARVGIPPHAMKFGDQYYALPSEAYIRDSFAKDFARLLRGLGIVYVPEKNDCEDFARLCSWFATHAHKNTPNSPSSGIAVGEAWFPSLAHAIVVAVHQSDTGELYLRFYEPQLNELGFACQPFNVSESDLKTAELIKI